MKAIAYQKSLPIDQSDSLQDIELPMPVVQDQDLLVEVKAIAANPVDCKIRLRSEPEAGQWKVLGWDASGVVKEVGKAVTLFKPGDEVWYAGDITRQGSNAQYQVVDERIVGEKPGSLSFAEAAAMPLTSVTAWELLFDRMEVDRKDSSKSILVIGAAGGVGSIMVQLLKRLTKLTVTGTASRAETVAWLNELGVDYVINHRNKLGEEFEQKGLPQPDYIVSLTATHLHFKEIVKLIKPQGKFGLIDDPEGGLNVMPFKQKSVSAHIELMYTRSMFQTPDMIEQHHILNKVSEMVDRGEIVTTLGAHFGEINAANLRKAQALLESGKAKGKIVMEGWGEEL